MTPNAASHHSCLTPPQGRWSFRFSTRALSHSLALSLVFLCCLQPWASAQELKPSLSGAHALVGVTVMVAPGETIENATIVVRDSVIVAVGQEITPPADAEVIKTDGLYVCPGFLAAGGEIGDAPKMPERKGSPSDYAAAPSHRARMGMTPERMTSTLLRSGSAKFDGKAWLAQGVTSVLLLPKGRLIPGQAALVSCADGGLADRMIRNSVATVASFRSSRGGYPSSLMGAVAALRQILFDARRQADWRSTYAQSPRGLAKPPEDPSLDALESVMRRKAPLLIKSQRNGDIRRTRRLIEEHGISAWIMGGSSLAHDLDDLQGSELTAILDIATAKPKHPKNQERVKALTADKAPANVEAKAEARDKASIASGKKAVAKSESAELEEKPAAEVESKTQSESKPAEAKESGISDKPADIIHGSKSYLEAKRAASEQKEWEALEPQLHAAQHLAEHNIPHFVGAAKPKDFLTHVRRQIACGWSEADAMTALTTEASRLLGVNQSHGRIAEGFTADMCVFEGHPFRTGQLRHVFNRGLRFDIKSKANKKASSKGTSTSDKKGNSDSTLFGTWEISMEGRSEPSTVVIKSATSGTMTSRRGAMEMTELSLTGKNATLVFAMDLEDGSIEITVEGTLGDDKKSMTGSVAFGAFGERSFKAVKTGAPK